MKKKDIFVGLFFVIFSLFLFRTYVLNPRLVPLPFNLLVSFYSPWKYETDLGFGQTVPNKPLGFDNIKLFYPFRAFTTQQLFSGRIPLWNPYVFSGNVQLGTFQAAVFYPFNLVYQFLSQADAWSVLIILQPILAGFFTFLFLRSLSISRQGSFIGAFGFAYSGWMMAHWEEVLVVEQSVLWLPLALFGSNVIREKSVRAGFIVLCVALSMSILGGFPQMVVYVFGVTVLWNIYRKSFVALFAVASSLAVTSVSWVPALEAYISSSRAIVDSSFLFSTFLSPLWYLVAFIVPDIWGNPGTYNYFSPLRYLQERTIAVAIGVFILAIFSLVLRDTSGKARFWKAFTLIALSLGFTLPTSWIWYVLKIPLLAAAQPARIFVLSTFGLCVLASFGFDQMMTIQRRGLLKKVILTLGSIFVILWVIVGGFLIVNKFVGQLQITDKKTIELIANVAAVSSRNLLISSVFFIANSFVLLYLKQRKIVFILLIFISAAWATYSASKILYFSDRNYEYPVVPPVAKLQELSGDYYRFWSYGDSYITRNISSYFHLYSPEGYEALYSHRYGRLLYTLVTKGTLTDDTSRTDVTLSETGQSEVMTNDPMRLRLMSLLGVKYLLEHKDREQPDRPASMRFPEELFKSVWEDDTWKIWEFTQVLPRAFFVSSYIVETDDQKIVDRLYDPATLLDETLVLEEKPLCCQTQAASSSSTVSIVLYEPETVELSVSADREGLVFLSDTYYPGWVATVDGKEAKIYRANFAFRAVYVPEGTHIVRFEYKPLSFQIGLWTSLISIIIVCLGIVRFL